MITAVVFLGLFGLAVMAMRAGPTPLARLERGYVFASVIPALLTLLLPSTFVGELVGERDRLVAAGAGLSLLLIPAGIVLLVRRKARTGVVDRRLAAAILVAGIPFLLVALLTLSWAVAHR
jgi:hypothetical protein